MSTADRATLAALAIAVVIVIGPYVMAGPNDMEEFFTGVSSTVLAWRAIADGDWFFWTMDVGLGAPQPTRFHLIPHPLSWLVLVLEPALAFRVIVAVHAIAAVISVWLLARRFGMSAPVAGVRLKTAIACSSCPAA